MPLLFLLALVLGVTAGSLLDAPGAAVVDPRLSTLLTTGGLVLASFAAVVAASREASGYVLLDRRVAPGEAGVRTSGPAEDPSPALPHAPEPTTTAGCGPSPPPVSTGEAVAAGWRLCGDPVRGGMPAGRTADGDGAVTEGTEPNGSAPEVRTVPILRLPGSRPCYRRWLAPEPPACGDGAAIDAWFGTVLRERGRLAWHNAGIALFVPLPGSVFGDPAAAQRLRRRLGGEAGIDMPLVPEIEASLALAEGGWRLRAWSGIEGVLPALRTAPLVPQPAEAAGLDLRFVLVAAGAMLRTADLPGDGATRVADWIAGLAAAGTTVVVTDVRDPRIVPRLVRLGVRFATGSGLAAAGETAPSRTLLAACGSGSATMPSVDRPPSRDPLPDPRGQGPAIEATGRRLPADVAAGTLSPLAARLREAGLRAARAPLAAEPPGAGVAPALQASGGPGPTGAAPA